jgi:hypothetical protein
MSTPEKIDLEKEADRFEIGGAAECVGFPFSGQEKMKAISEELHRKREEAVPRINEFFSKLGSELEKKGIKLHHVETEHDVHAFYTVKDGRYVHVQAYPGFSFPPYAKEGQVCLMASYRSMPKDHSNCLSSLAEQHNYSSEEVGKLADIISKNIKRIDKK